MPAIKHKFPVYALSAHGKAGKILKFCGQKGYEIIMYDLFSDFFDGFDVFPVYHEENRCPNCGKTYYEFQKSGKFGCAECYKAFEKPVRETLRQVQASTVHTGKIPSKQSEGLKKKRRLADLKTKLSKAVAAEDYETAAKLHREIKELEG